MSVDARLPPIVVDAPFALGVAALATRLGPVFAGGPTRWLVG